MVAQSRLKLLVENGSPLQKLREILCVLHGLHSNWLTFKKEEKKYCLKNMLVGQGRCSVCKSKRGMCELYIYIHKTRPMRTNISESSYKKTDTMK